MADVKRHEQSTASVLALSPIADVGHEVRVNPHILCRQAVPIALPICLSVCPSVRVFRILVGLSGRLPVCLSSCLPPSLPACLPICLFVCLPVCLSLSLSLTIEQGNAASPVPTRTLDEQLGSPQGRPKPLLWRRPLLPHHLLLPHDLLLQPRLLAWTHPCHHLPSLEPPHAPFWHPDYCPPLKPLDALLRINPHTQIAPQSGTHVGLALVLPHQDQVPEPQGLPHLEQRRHLRGIAHRGGPEIQLHGLTAGRVSPVGALQLAPSPKYPNFPALPNSGSHLCLTSSKQNQFDPSVGFGNVVERYARNIGPF